MQALDMAVARPCRPQDKDKLALLHTLGFKDFIGERRIIGDPPGTAAARRAAGPPSGYRAGCYSGCS
jgi:hypothetical protein